MKFLLDANFLMIPGKFKVDVFSELERFGRPELYTLDLVVKELEKMHANLALIFIKKKKIKILKTKSKNVKNTDKEIIRIAKEKGVVVCTQDKKLILKLKKENVAIVSLRQRKYLERV